MTPVSLATMLLAAFLIGPTAVDAQVLRRGSGPNPGAVADRIEKLAQLDPALQDIDLTKEQKDSLARIEKQYRKHFTQLANDARAKFQGEGRPDRAGLMQLGDSARTLREAEWTAAREPLTPEQRTTFDKNVARLREEAAQRAARMRERMGGRRS